MNAKCFSFLFLILFLPISFSFAATETFSRNLSLGMRGEDVRALQKILNNDPETSVALKGAGSLGNETDYFGPATKRALALFQEKYRSEILAPVGLTSGTGFLGEKTRAKMNTIATARNKEPVATAFPAQKKKVFLKYPSQYSGKPGTAISLLGEGFTGSGNTIYFGESLITSNAVSLNGNEIAMKVPNLPKGVYKLFLKNENGDSNKGVFFVVTDGVTHAPKIESISPEMAIRGGVVTVKGVGFSRTGNVVQYGAGVYKDISSADGETISFLIPVNLFSATSSSAKKMSLPLWVHVINENGISNEKGFTLEL